MAELFINTSVYPPQLEILALTFTDMRQDSPQNHRPKKREATLSRTPVGYGIIRFDCTLSEMKGKIISLKEEGSDSILRHNGKPGCRFKGREHSKTSGL